MNVIKFATLHADAKIPSKNVEDAGYDIYPAFDGSYIAIQPGQTKMIPTGICSAFDDNYVMVVKERGSTGTKGIGQRAGIIDSGYRGEWFIPITNHNPDATLFISKIGEDKIKILCSSTLTRYPYIYYPYEKAIAQALLLPVPKVEVVECTAEEIAAIPSKRGDGALGSSGK